jgi:hypothetical protein
MIFNSWSNLLELAVVLFPNQTIDRRQLCVTVLFGINTSPRTRHRTPRGSESHPKIIPSFPLFSPFLSPHLNFSEMITYFKMNFTLFVPEGTTNHSDPRLICTPRNWKDYIVFSRPTTSSTLLPSRNIPAKQ